MDEQRPKESKARFLADRRLYNGPVGVLLADGLKERKKTLLQNDSQQREKKEKSDDFTMNQLLVFLVFLISISNFLRSLFETYTT